jgi:hypothetical protein
MRWIVLFSLFAALPALAQEVLLPTAEAPVPKITAREKWGLTMEQYALIDPSRRPSGDTFKYWKARKRGPYGNLLERVPGWTAPPRENLMFMANHLLRLVLLLAALVLAGCANIQF